MDLPQNLLSSLHNVEFVCPKCRRKLEVLEIGYHCENCKKSYLLHSGIPDFRIFPDPFLTYEEDYKRTEIVLAELNNLNFEELLEYYWSFSDITPLALRPKFIRSAILGEMRAHQTLRVLEGETKSSAGKILEIGCGTGNFLAVAISSGKQIIGIDVAMRWLHLSRRRFMDAGLSIPPLVCCNAEFLPFADNSFRAAVAASTFEFVGSQVKVLSECRRVLDKNGTFYLNSVNRYSIAKDPYAYLYGIGFLPRKWQASYVKWRRGASYENIKTLSYREFKRLASHYFSIKKFALPDVASTAIKEFTVGTRLQINVYKFLKKIPLVSFVLLRVGPGWDVILQKNLKH